MIITKDFDIRLFSFLCLGFILFTVIGTLSHEFGHYAVARILGYDAHINFGFTKWSTPKGANFISNYYDGELITLAGPLQTIITGTLGFIFLFRKRSEINLNNDLSLRRWFAIFLTLFWLREVFNFLIGIPGYFSQGCFVEMGDEETLALNRHLPVASFILPLAIIASSVLSYTYFRFIPYKHRLTFLVAGLVGGLLGFYLWMFELGPVIMPYVRGSKSLLIFHDPGIAHITSLSNFHHINSVWFF